MGRWLAVLILVGAACTPPAALPQPSQSAPVAVPTVVLERLDGAQTTLAAELGGRPALVTLWATWCDGCRDELAPLGRLAARAEASGARVVALDVGESSARVAAFVRAHGIGYPQLLDPGFHFSDALGRRRVPTTLVVDRAGRIVYAGGALDEAALAALRRALAGDASNAKLVPDSTTR